MLHLYNSLAVEELWLESSCCNYALTTDGIQTLYELYTQHFETSIHI